MNLLFSQMAKAVAERFASDPSSPSVLLSYIAEKGVFYASIQRYGAPFGGRKSIICKAEGATVDDCVNELWKAWNIYFS